MKRKRILKALAILAVAALGLFVSCSGNIMDDVSDTLVYATFDKNSRATSSYTQTVTLKEIDEVYWTYTATKADSAGQTGETTSQTAVKSSFGTGLDGAIGPFSQGEWEFTVYGYTSAPTTQPSGTENADWVNVGTNQYYSGLIYRGSGNATLSTGTQSNPDPINVVINLLTDGAGTFSISNASDFSWQEDSGSAYSGMYLTMLASDDTTTKSEAFALEYDTTAKKYYFKKTDNKWPTLSWDFSSGSWYMEFAVVKANTDSNAPEYTEKTGTYSSGGTYKYYSWDGIKYTFTTSPELLVKVYAGQETTLEAKIIESNLAWGEFNGSVESVKASTVMATVEANSDTTLESNITPQTASSDTIESDIKTTITVPSGTNEFTSGSTAAVTVTATPLVTANSLFKISSSSGAVGAIDLKATVATTSDNGVTETKNVESFTTGSGESKTAVAVTISTYIAKGMTNVALTYTKDGTAETWKEGATSASGDDIKAPSSGTEGVCYYNAETGQLVYKTTHFSTFLVGADQNVYDANSGVAYVLKDADNDGTYHIYNKDGEIIKESSSDSNDSYSSATLGANLVLLDCALSNNVPDAFVSDCTTEDKDKKTWSVIHHNCSKQEDGFWHAEYHESFSSGYGTKLEPYTIQTIEQFRTIDSFWNNYAYYKISDDYENTELTEWTGYNYCLNGSFDGNGKSFTNLKTSLFSAVGFYNSEGKYCNEKMMLKNFSVDVNIDYPYGTGLISCIGNSGETIFKNIKVTGTITSTMNTGTFYAYGTAIWGENSGISYTVSFENCVSSVTLICTTGNSFGGFIGHGYEGSGNTLTLNIDENSKYEGEMYNTAGTGNRYIGMCSNPKNIIFNGTKVTEEYKDVNGGEAYDHLNNLSVKNPELGDNGYTVEKQTNANKYVVDLSAQLTAYKDDNATKIPNLSGITLTIKRSDLTEGLDGRVLLDSVSKVIISKNNEGYDYSISDGTLTIELPGSTNYRTGTVTLNVTQYCEDKIVSCGSVEIMSCNNPAGTGTWNIKEDS